MHPFPAAASLKFLVEGDANLDAITLARFTAFFSFDNGASVSWTGPITFVSAAGFLTQYEGPWAEQRPLMLHGLLGAKVIDVVTSDWVLTLMFAAGERLSFHSEDGAYESGIISDPAKREHVF